MNNDCVIRNDLIPITITPEKFYELWKENKDKLLKIHTRKINRQLNIEDENGKQYHLITRRGNAQLIPKSTLTPSLSELADKIETLEKAEKEYEFLDNRVRAIESSFQRMLSKLELPPTSEDETIIAESLYTPEQKERENILTNIEQKKSERQKERINEKNHKEIANILTKVNEELASSGCVLFTDKPYLKPIT